MPPYSLFACVHPNRLDDYRQTYGAVWPDLLSAVVPTHDEPTDRERTASPHQETHVAIRPAPT